MASLSYELEQIALGTLLSWYQEGKLNLAPVFQRSDVWLKAQRVNLIDSILQRYPTPSIFLYKRQNGTRIVSLRGD